MAYVLTSNRTPLLNFTMQLSSLSMQLVQRYTNFFFQVGHSRSAFQSLSLFHIHHRHRQFVCPSSVVTCFSPSTRDTAHNAHIVTAAVVPWLRCLVASLSPQTPGFEPMPVCDGICGRQSCTATSFSPRNWLVSCHYLHNNAPYSYRRHIKPSGANMFQKPKSHLKILGARRVTWWKFHTTSSVLSLSRLTRRSNLKDRITFRDHKNMEVRSDVTSKQRSLHAVRVCTWDCTRHSESRVLAACLGARNPNRSKKQTGQYNALTWKITSSSKTILSVYRNVHGIDLCNCH